MPNLDRVLYEIQRLNDKLNALLFWATGGRAPFLSPGGDIAWQYRSDIAAHEVLYIRSNYQRIFHDDLVLNGELILDGKALII